MYCSEKLPKMNNNIGSQHQTRTFLCGHKGQINSKPENSKETSLFYSLNHKVDPPEGLLSEFTASDQIRSVAQSCPTLCDPMNRSTPGLPVHHQLPEFTQTHIHRVSDAIQRKLQTKF